MAIEDTTGNVVVAGVTTQSGFPTTVGGFDTTFNGGDDNFVAKLDSNLENLLASTYLGGSSSDGYYDDGFSHNDDSTNGQATVAIGSDGSIFVAGFSGSSNFPTSTTAYEQSYNGNFDSFIVKFDTNLSTLQASTFLGGSSYEWIYSITTDTTGNLYALGVTASSDFPYTDGAYDSSHNGGKDIFIARFNNNLTELKAATFLGGSVDDGYTTDGDKRSISVTATNEIIIVGETASSDFPTTTGVYDQSHNGNTDGFIAKLDTNLTELKAATFLGGAGSDTIFSLAQDTDHNIYVTGWAWGSSDFPVTTDADDSELGGEADAYLAILNSDLTALSYASYFGGSGLDMAYHISINAEGDIYLAGGTCSTDLPATDSAYGFSHNGGGGDSENCPNGQDAFVAKVSIDLSLDGETTDDAESDEVAISGLSLSQTELQAEVPVTVTATTNSTGQTIYYKFYYCANYGTDDYSTTPWTVVQDYSTANSAVYTFPSSGNYIIVVRAVTDANNEPAALPIIGQAIVVGDANQVSLVSMTVDATTATKAGDTVTVTATASDPDSQTIYYQFYYCANYGTSGYETTSWTLVQAYSTSNSCQYVFPSDGNYIIVVRAVTDPNNEPTALPIIGSAISIR